MPEQLSLSPSHQKIFDVVVRIPRGKVMTYGDVAKAAGLGGAARLVGYAMHALGPKVPWQRVLGKRKAGLAHITIGDALSASTQRRKLEAEGVDFNANGTVDLARYGFTPRARPKASHKETRRSAR